MSLAPGTVLARRLAMVGIALAGIWAGIHAWRPNESALGAVGDAVAVVGVGTWLGSAVARLFLPKTLRRGSASDAEAAGGRSSRLGLALLGIGAVAGGWRVWALAGGTAGLVGTRHGRLLLVAWTLVLLALAMALARTLRPPRPDAGRARAMAIDIALGLGIAITGVLGVAAGDRSESPIWPFAFRLAPHVTWAFPGVRDQVLTGIAYVAVGFVASMAAWRWASWRPIALAVAVVLLPWGVYAALAPMSLDAYPTTYARSPVPYTSSTVSSGQRIFADHCAACHGARGRGDGPAANSLLQRPADLTAPHTGDHTPGDIYWWITNGLGLAMPPFGDSLTAGERWELISFVRALASAERARTLTDAVQVGGEGPVAPDFSFSANGVGRRLRDVVRREPVLLVLFTVPGSSARLSELSRARADLVRAGALVVAAPMDGVDGAPASADGLSIVTKGSTAVAGAYGLFASTGLPSDALPNPAGPAHAELLIDKGGYLRARWIPGEPGPGWADLARLSTQIRFLRDEAARRPAPAELE